LLSPANLIIVLLVTVSFYAVQSFTTTFSDKLGTFYSLFDTKYNIASTKLTDIVSSDVSEDHENQDVDLSEKTRSFQIETAFFYANDPASMLFGGPISIGTVIENENYFMVRSYGYVGLF